MSMPAGQPLRHLDSTSALQAPATQRPYLTWDSYSARKCRIVVRMGLGAVQPRLQSEVLATVSAISYRRSTSPGAASPWQMRTSMSNICFVPTRQGTHLPHDSA